MKRFFDQNPNTFRLLFLLVALVPLGTAILNFYHYLNRGIDQSIFADSQSRLYVQRPITAKLLNNRPKIIQDDPYFSIQVGDLIMRVNDTPVNTLEEFTRQFQNLGPNAFIKLTVQRPTQPGLFLEFQLIRRFLPRDVVREIPRTIYIYDVPKGGAANRAGLRIGDLIYRIDGREFSGARAADYLVRRSMAGQTLTYDIIRDNQMLSLKVTMSRVQISLLVLLLQICGFLWVAAGIFLAMTRPQLAAGRLLSLGFFFCGISFTLMVNRGYLESDWQRLLLIIFTFPSHFFGFATLLHASYYFPMEKTRLLTMGWPRFSSYPLALAATVVSIYFTFRLYFIWIILIVGTDLFITFKYRRYISRQNRSQERILMIGSIVASTIISVWAIFRTQLPPLWQTLLPCLTISIFLASYLITIARYRLLGFQVRRSLQYGLVAGTWSIGLTVLFFIGIWFLSKTEIPLPNLRLTASTIEINDAPMNAKRAEDLQKFSAMVLGLAIAIGIFAIGRRGVHWLRHKFHRSPYDFHKVTQELHELMTTRLPLNALAKGIVNKLANLMFLKQVGIVFYRGKTIVAFQEAFEPQDPNRPLCMKSCHTLCETMKRYHSELCVDYLEPKLKAMLTSQGYRYIYPIYSKDTLVGLLMVGEKLSEFTFRHEDFAFLSTTSRQASVAIENGFLYEKISEQERFKQELDLARRIQLTSLPQTTPKVRGLRIAGTSMPALEVGGDFYDYFAEGDSVVTVLVGDVSGKGTSAALYMSKLQGIFRTLFQDNLSPMSLFIKANGILYRELDKASFITALGARFDMNTGEVKYSRAGHIPLIHLRAGSDHAEYLHSSGMGLGLERGELLRQIQEEHTRQFSPGDLFLLVSDGITEAYNSGNQPFGEDRLLRVLEQSRDFPPQKILTTILTAVGDFCHDCEQHDDQTLVVVRIETPDPEGGDPREETQEKEAP